MTSSDVNHAASITKAPPPRRRRRLPEPARQRRTGWRSGGHAAGRRGRVPPGGRILCSPSPRALMMEIRNARCSRRRNVAPRRWIYRWRVLSRQRRRGPRFPRFIDSKVHVQGVSNLKTRSYREETKQPVILKQDPIKSILLPNNFFCNVQNV